MRKTAVEFIRDHHYIKYCEALIYKDGTIDYAQPSHSEALIRETGIERERLWDIIPITASPIIWLIDYTGCISVWSNGYMGPTKYTEEQDQALDLLIKADLVRARDLTER